MHYRKTVSLLIGALMFAGGVLADTADQGDTWSKVQERGEGEIRVLYVPASGWAYQDEDGRLTGVTVELMRDFADWIENEHEVELTVEFVEEPDWSVFYGRVRDGKDGVFGVGNVTITDERREELAFSPPYIINVAVGISHEDVPELESESALADTFDGLSALAFSDTLHEDRLQALREAHAPDIPLERADTNDEIIERVAEGDYFAYIDAYNYWRAREAGKPLRHHPVLDDPGEAFGVIMPRDSDWPSVMDDYFEHGDGLLESRFYRELLEEHLGKEVARLLLEK